MLGPHVLVGNLGGSRLIPALLLPSLTHNAPQTESSALCSVQPHTPTHPQGTSQATSGLPTDCVPSCPQGPPQALLPSLPVHSENQGKGVPTWTLVLHVQPKCHRHCPLQAWSSPHFRSCSRLRYPLLPSQPPFPQSSAPRAVLLWPTEAALSCSVLPHPLVWPSGTPAAQPSLHTSLRGFHWGPHPCPLGSCCPIKWTSFGERGTRETDAEDTNRTLSSIYKSRINNECF